MKAQHPSPIPEKLNVDVDMLNDAPIVITTSLTGTTPDVSPLASADDFPVDH
jgi:hypothetical protein